MRTDRANAPRFELGRDHVESWFLRANDPTWPRALWLKATVLTRADGTSLVQAWCNTFDSDLTHAFCTEVELPSATFGSSDEGTLVDLGPIRMELTGDGVRCRGELHDAGSTVSWEIELRRLAGVLGEPLSLLPSDRLIEGGFPKNKLLSPFPAGTCSGRLVLNGETWDLDGWSGMQGHNWGAAHSPEYAWGQCLFEQGGVPFAMVEGASGRTPIGSRNSPLISMLVVRHGDVEYRFDRLLDLWRQRPEIAFPSWKLAMSGRDGRVELSMTADPHRMVRLDYENPARPTSSCYNSKTAEVTVRVTPRRGAALTLHSDHGGALEFLTDRKDLL